VEFNQHRFEAAYQVVQLSAAATDLSLPVIKLHLYETALSTNQTVWELLAQGAPAGTTVLALRQTAGRGQWGRQWSSLPGGLYLSTALAPDLPVKNSAQLTLCTAWGIAKALRDIPGRLSGVAGQIPVQVKWPNDLVLLERKLGGILTETRVRQETITEAVVGVGINWTNPVPETGINLKSYLENQDLPLIESLEMLTASVLYGLLSGYQYWQQKGMDALLSAYLELLAYRDRLIVVNGLSGTIVGVTSTGELKISLHTSNSARNRDLQTEDTSHSEILLKPGTINLGYGSSAGVTNPVEPD